VCALWAAHTAQMMACTSHHAPPHSRPSAAARAPRHPPSPPWALLTSGPSASQTASPGLRTGRRRWWRSTPGCTTAGGWRGKRGRGEEQRTPRDGERRPGGTAAASHAAPAQRLAPSLQLPAPTCRRRLTLRELKRCRPSFSVTSATGMALGKSCLLANTSSTASRSSSSDSMRSNSARAAGSGGKGVQARGWGRRQRASGRAGEGVARCPAPPRATTGNRQHTHPRPRAPCRWSPPQK
jgi:hypothetical protein